MTAYAYDSIKFCTVCETAYATALVDGVLTLACRNCSNEEPTQNIVVHRTLFDTEEIDKATQVTRFTKHDVSLPLTTKKTCPTCGATRAKYMKRKDSGMALMYICTACDGVWTY